MGTLIRPDAEIAFEHSGHGRTGVLVHGFGTSREILRDLAERLRSCGALDATVLIDLRGHGASHAGDDAAMTYEAMRDDLLALLRPLDLERVDWIGHSMGGQVALLAALAEPERANCLTTIGAGPCRAIEDPREQRSWQRAADFFEGASGAALAAALADAAPLAVPPRPELAPEQVYAGADGGALARIVREGFFSISSNDEDCRSLAVPTLVLAGASDGTWLEPSRKLASLIPGAELGVLDAAGHLAPLEQPAATADTIADFLKRQRAGAARS